MQAVLWVEPQHGGKARVVYFVCHPPENAPPDWAWLSSWMRAGWHVTQGLASGSNNTTALLMEFP